MFQSWLEQCTRACKIVQVPKISWLQKKCLRWLSHWQWDTGVNKHERKRWRMFHVALSVLTFSNANSFGRRLHTTHQKLSKCRMLNCGYRPWISCHHKWPTIFCWVMVAMFTMCFWRSVKNQELLSAQSSAMIATVILIIRTLSIKQQACTSMSILLWLIRTCIVCFWWIMAENVILKAVGRTNRCSSWSQGDKGVWLWNDFCLQLLLNIPFSLIFLLTCQHVVNKLINSKISIIGVNCNNLTRSSQKL